MSLPQITARPRLARWLSLALIGCVLLLASPGAFGQKLARDYFEDPPNGYRFKPLDGYTSVPLQPDERGGPLAAQLTSGENKLWVMALYDPPAEEEVEGRTRAGKRREEITAVLSSTLNGFKNKADSPTTDETVKVKGIESRHRIWELTLGRDDYFIEVWTFPLVHADVSLIYITEKQRFDRRWASVIDKSAKSFAEIERVANQVIELGKGASYEDHVEAAKQREAANPGWSVVTTPSKKFIIVTSSVKRNFLDELIKRLEGSRTVFEKDFPPSPDFNAISIVRVCATEEEFHQYGGTGDGVAGWFSPMTTELVLYDAVNIDRNMTYAVVVHESFHQYCHFLFGQAEAHRWFDEGHGDYYGGLEFKTSRPKITPTMPSGLDRYGEIKEMIRAESYKPVKEHINQDHRQWQSQGPTGVSSYAQSWSIIYYLRQGAEGKVPRKFWNPDYAEIIPNYVRVLTAEYKKLFDEIEEARKKKGAGNGEGDEADEPGELNRQALLMRMNPARKNEIWKAAMEASWGKIDMDKFEQDWLVYVMDGLQ